MKIGVFDSGMGGLSVLNGLVNLFSDNEYIYVADNKYSPYGTKTDEELINRGLAIIKYFESVNTELIIIACNTMSVYLDILQKYTNIKVLGVIKPTVHYVSSLGVNEVGLIATYNTVRNKTYQNMLLDLGIKTDALNCSFLVEIVEGKSNESASLLLKENSKNNHFESLTHLILGCTHFNLLKEEIKEVLPNINLVDTTDGIINELIKMGLTKKEQVNLNPIKIYSTLDVENLQSLIKKYNLFINNKYEVNILDI